MMPALTGSPRRSSSAADQPAITAAARRKPRRVGHLRRQWRQQRRMSQLDLALSADVSSRHLSFIETGRSAPSREMILQLARQLDLPLREQNRLLQAAGYAPAYTELPLDAPGMDPVRAAVRQLLNGHEPYPATLLDWRWNIVERNAATDLFLEDVAPELATPPINVMRLCLHPAGLAPRIVDLAAFRGRLLHRLRRQLDVMPDAGLDALLRELKGYPGAEPGAGQGGGGPRPAGGDDVVWPLRIRHRDRTLAFFTTVAAFGTPLDITVSELVIESFFPADETTAAVLRTRQRRRRAA
jgi:transcriptional regulator with XRE-family HTH domain